MSRCADAQGCIAAKIQKRFSIFTRHVQPVSIESAKSVKWIGNDYPNAICFGAFVDERNWRIVCGPSVIVRVVNGGCKHQTEKEHSQARQFCKRRMCNGLRRHDYRVLILDFWSKLFSRD